MDRVGPTGLLVHAAIPAWSPVLSQNTWIGVNCMDVPAEKPCKACPAILPITAFSINKAKKDGRESICKNCDNKHRRTRYAQNPEASRKRQNDAYANRSEEQKEQRNIKRQHDRVVRGEEIRAQEGQSRSRNRNQRNMRRRKQRAANPESFRVYERINGQKHIEKRRQRDREKYQINPEKYLSRMRKARIEKPEMVKAQRTRYSKKHPLEIRMGQWRRRARVHNMPIVDEFTLLEIADRDNWTCHICHKKVTRKTWSIDHHFPVSQPGAIHGRQYVSLAHKRCNAQRGTGKLPAQLRLLP
jgi:hypothetical protein